MNKLYGIRKLLVLLHMHISFIISRTAQMHKISKEWPEDRPHSFQRLWPNFCNGWQRKHDFQVMSLTRLLLRITEQRQLRLGRQQRDRCSLVLTACPKWSCITLSASYHTCRSFLSVHPLWVRAQLAPRLFYLHFLSCLIISWCQVLHLSSTCERTSLKYKT